MELAKAMLIHGQDHEFLVILNGSLSEGAWEVRRQLDGLISPKNIYLWHSIGCLGSWHDNVPEQSRAAFFRWRIDEITRLRREFIQSLNADIVHVCHQFEGFDSVPATINETAPWAATSYDFIPYHYAEQYLNTERVKAWYLERLESLKRANLFLAISEHARQETIELLGVSPDKVTNILAAADEQFQRLDIVSEERKKLFNRLGISRDFLIYTGGFDSRKNVEALVRSFAALPTDLRQSHQLLLVGMGNHISDPIFYELEKNLGFAADEVLHTGFISDSDLVMLYNTCKLMVMPSLHEGFGLPVLEAMSCGAPVIASGLTSLPEVVGNPDALFDPTTEVQITTKIVQVLRDDNFRSALAETGYKRSAIFSWKESARKAIQAFENYAESSGNKGRTARETRPRGFSQMP